MQRNIAIISLFLFAIVFLNFHTTAKAEPIEIAIYVEESYPPYIYTENSMAKGLYIDVLRTAFDRMEDFKVTLLPVSWQRGKKIMERGQGIGLVPPYFHGHDWPYLHPYSLPFYMETVRVYCRETLPFGIESRSWPNGFKGLRIGNMRGYDGWGGEAFHQLVKNKEVDYYEADTLDNLINMGMRERLDCFLMEESAFTAEYNSLLEHYNSQGTPYKSIVKGPVTGIDPVYIGYSRPARLSGKFPSMHDFMQAFDAEIYKMRKSGEIKKIMSR